MSKDREFTITEDHLKLLRSMYVGWDDCEFGAPAIDCKRPYGNSDVLGDIREILGLPINEEDDWRDEGEDADELRRLHKDMQTVLQILVRSTHGIYAGKYVKDTPYGVDWTYVNE